MNKDDVISYFGGVSNLARLWAFLTHQFPVGAA